MFKQVEIFQGSCARSLLRVAFSATELMRSGRTGRRLPAKDNWLCEHAATPGAFLPEIAHRDIALSQGTSVARGQPVVEQSRSMRIIAPLNGQPSFVADSSNPPLLGSDAPAINPDQIRLIDSVYCCFYGVATQRNRAFQPRSRTCRSRRGRTARARVPLPPRFCWLAQDQTDVQVNVQPRTGVTGRADLHFYFVCAAERSQAFFLLS